MEPGDLEKEPEELGRPSLETGLEKVDGGEQGRVAAYDPVKRYLAEVRRYPFLTREEEFQLASVFRKSGDRQAVTRLILSNLRVVVSVAMGYRFLPFPLLDLIQEGNIGLLQAVKKFDPDRNIRLATYATWWIRAYILRYILNNWRLVKIGTTQNQRKLFFNLSKEKEKLEKQGYDVEPKLLADRLNVREKDVVEMEQRLGNWEVSLDEPVGPDSEDSLGQLVPSREIPVDEKIADEEIRDLIQKALRSFSGGLKARDLDILQNRLLSDDPLTLEALSQRYKISKERVRQLEANLIKKLRAYLTERVPGVDQMDLRARQWP